MSKPNDRVRHSFLKGSLVLGVSMLIVKLIGMFYKIILTNMLGVVGNGILSVTYELYNPLFMLATAGFPIAISRMVSESVATKRYNDVKKIHRVSVPFLFITGILGFLIMLASSFAYCNIAQTPSALPAVICLSPTILFACLMSIYRGYYEGQRNMMPTAISEIIEAVSKLVIGLVISYLTLQYGLNQYRTTGKFLGVVYKNEDLAQAAIVPYAVAAAFIGISLGAFFGFVFLLLRHKIKGEGITKQEYAQSPPARDGKSTFNRLVRTAIPIGTGALIMSFAGLIDTILVNNRLKNIMDTNPSALLKQYGNLIPADVVFNNTTHTFLFGCFSLSLTIMMLITALTQVFGQSALPSVTNAYARGNRKDLKYNIETVIKTTCIFTLPAGLGLTVLAQPILSLLYTSRPNEITIAANVLQIMGISGIFIATSTPLCSMLQAVGCVDLPLKLFAVGMVIKVALNYLLVGIPAINIQGATVGSLVCYAMVCFVALYYLCKQTKIIPNFNLVLIKPLIASAFCAITAYFSYQLFDMKFSNKIAVILAIVAAIIIYAIMLLILRVITKNDLLSIPKGEKIAKTLEKFHLIG
ncbi:MAG: polysaccharide biosynthesis protein [Bacillota bacterium]|nr:polysaccharide biosynthesis protein [Bacillota bacterium]